MYNAFNKKKDFSWYSIDSYAWNFVVVTRQDTFTPIITVTEDTSPHADEADFVKYFGLEAHAEGSI